jgi:hypothetical protein
MSHDPVGWLMLFKTLIQLLRGKIGVLRLLGIIAMATIIALVCVALRVLAISAEVERGEYITSSSYSLVNSCILVILCVFLAVVAFLAFMVYIRVPTRPVLPRRRRRRVARPAQRFVNASGGKEASQNSDHQSSVRRTIPPTGRNGDLRQFFREALETVPNATTVPNPPKTSVPSSLGSGAERATDVMEQVAVKDSLRHIIITLDIVAEIMRQRRISGDAFDRSTKLNILALLIKCREEALGIEADPLANTFTRLKAVVESVEAGFDTQAGPPIMVSPRTNWSGQYVDKTIEAILDCAKDFEEALK